MAITATVQTSARGKRFIRIRVNSETFKIYLKEATVST